jgi:hypothetical protein
MVSAICLDSLTLADDGALLCRAVALPVMAELLSVLAELPAHQAGVRISGLPALSPYLAPDGAIGGLVSRALGADARAVRAILFDKSQDTNWSLAWHQDRTICVRERVEVEGFGPWSIKAGLHHVAPPFELLSRHYGDALPNPQTLPLPLRLRPALLRGECKPRAFLHVGQPFG